MGGEAKDPRAGEGSGREARLAAALRDNLRRRKDQARARKADAGHAEPVPNRETQTPDPEARDTHER